LIKKNCSINFFSIDKNSNEILDITEITVHYQCTALRLQFALCKPSRLWYIVLSICRLSVCRLSVTFCIVAKRYVVEGRRWYRCIGRW